MMPMLYSKKKTNVSTLPLAPILIRLVLEDEEQQKTGKKSNKISTFGGTGKGSKVPMLNTVGAKPMVSKPNQPIVIDETKEVELERPGTAKSQVTNADKFDDDDLFGEFSAAKKYVG